MNIVQEVRVLTSEGIFCQGSAALWVIGLVCGIFCMFWWTMIAESVRADSDCFGGGE